MCIIYVFIKNILGINQDWTIIFSQYVSGFQIDMTMVHATMRPLLQYLSDFSNLNLHRIRVLSSLMQIFPHTFNEKLCEQMIVSVIYHLELL